VFEAILMNSFSKGLYKLLRLSHLKVKIIGFIKQLLTEFWCFDWTCFS